MTWEEAIEEMGLMETEPVGADKELNRKVWMKETRNRFLKLIKHSYGEEYSLCISTLDRGIWVNLITSEYPEPIIAMEELLHYGLR